MLPKENRLKNTKEIERVFREGRGLKKGFLFVKFIKNDLTKSRFAFIVSRKTAKKAVRRNQIKRREREIIRKNLSRIKTGFDFVFVAQKGIEKSTFRDIEKNIETILNNLWGH